MTEDNKTENKEEPEIELDEVLFQKVLDAITKMIKEDEFNVRSTPDGFAVRIKSDKFKKNFPDMTISEVVQVVEFIGRYVHYQTCHDLDTFYESFKKTKKGKVEEITNFVKSHEVFGALVFRILRRTNFLLGPLESHVRTVELFGKEETLAKYYNVSVPFIDGNGEEIVLTLELDRIELETLVAALARQLEER